MGPGIGKNTDNKEIKNTVVYIDYFQLYLYMLLLNYVLPHSLPNILARQWILEVHGL